jgi:hypothetical protein
VPGENVALNDDRSHNEIADLKKQIISPYRNPIYLSIFSIKLIVLLMIIKVKHYVKGFPPDSPHKADSAPPESLPPRLGTPPGREEAVTFWDRYSFE